MGRIGGLAPAAQAGLFVRLQHVAVLDQGKCYVNESGPEPNGFSGFPESPWDVGREEQVWLAEWEQYSDPSVVTEQQWKFVMQRKEGGEF